MKSYSLPFVLFLLTALACGTPRTVAPVATIPYRAAAEDRMVILQFSQDSTYGYSVDNPVLVGGVPEGIGPSRERLFLNALTGPGAEPILYRRLQSCCAFKTPNGFGGVGLLDVYEVTYDGLATPFVLYLNMYDEGEVFVPVGFRGGLAR